MDTTRISTKPLTNQPIGRINVGKPGKVGKTDLIQEMEDQDVTWRYLMTMVIMMMMITMMVKTTIMMFMMINKLVILMIMMNMMIIISTTMVTIL